MQNYESKLKIVKTCSSVKLNRGFTLIELLISCVILVTVILLVNQVYLLGMIQSKSDLKKARLQSEGKSALGGITKNIKLAASVESSYGTYIGNSTTLILKIPAIDAHEEFLYAAGVREYDYIIYYLSGKNLRKAVISFDGKSRIYPPGGNSDSIILSDVKNQSLSFVYDTKAVTAVFTLEDTTGKDPIEVSFSEKGRLRNDEE